MKLTSSPTASEMSFIFWIPILDPLIPKKPGQPQFSTTSSNLQVTVSSKMDIQELSESEIVYQFALFLSVKSRGI